jgi:uncharacterized spore protein YtfJ
MADSAEDRRDFMANIGDQLTGLANGDLVVGTELTLGDVTIVPLTHVSFGFGGGGGEEAATDKQPRNVGSGDGTGGGGNIKPVAVAVFRKDGVEIMRLPEKPSAMARLLEQVPDLIDKFKS